MEGRIKAWTEETMNPEVKCGLQQCYRCKGMPAQFKRHDRRSRVFLMVVRDVVKRFDSHVLRWKCPICGRILTELPAFALRFKRYVAQTVLELTRSFLDGGLGVASGIVTDQRNQPLTYVRTAEGGEQFCTEQLWASTVRRWVQWLNGLRQTLREGKRLLRAIQTDPMTHLGKVFRQTYPTGRDLLLVDAQFRKHFGHSVFPNFASQHGWR